MDPVTAMMAIQGGMSLMKGIFGGVQSAQAKNALNGLRRPMMQMSPEATAALDNAKKNALMTTLPGQDLMQQGIDRNTQANANALAEVNTGGSLMEGVNRAYQQGANKITDLDIAAAELNRVNQGALQNQLGIMANRRDEMFKVNELDPYMQKYQELNNQKAAGQQNLWGGISGVASAVGSGMGMMQEQDLTDKIYQLGKYAPKRPADLSISPMSARSGIMTNTSMSPLQSMNMLGYTPNGIPNYPWIPKR